MSALEELQFPQGERLRPAAPFPHSRNLSTLQVLRELGRNPVAAFGQNGYREFYIHSRTFVSDFLMVSDPEGIKYVLLDNAANFPKALSRLRARPSPHSVTGWSLPDGASWRNRSTPRHLADVLATPCRGSSRRLMVKRLCEGDARALAAHLEMARLIDGRRRDDALTYDINIRALCRSPAM